MGPAALCRRRLRAVCKTSWIAQSMRDAASTAAWLRSSDRHGTSLTIYDSLLQVSLLVNDQVLDGFHSHKKERGVDETLVKLYEPILWRALKVGHKSPHCYHFLSITTFLQGSQRHSSRECGSSHGRWVSTAKSGALVCRWRRVSRPTCPTS